MAEIGTKSEKFRAYAGRSGQKTVHLGVETPAVIGFYSTVVGTREVLRTLGKLAAGVLLLLRWRSALSASRRKKKERLMKEQAAQRPGRRRRA